MKRSLFSSVLGSCSLVLLAGCGAGDPGPVPEGPQAASAADGGGPGTFGTDDTKRTLVLEPKDAVLDVTAPGATLKLRAVIAGTTTEVPASWGVDVADMGSIGQDGTFKATAKVGGVTRILARSGELQAEGSLTVKLKLSENRAGIDTATQTKLRAGGTADAGFKWLYPYDKTVFPRGLAAPDLQFAGSKADAMRVRVTAKNLDVETFFAGSAPLRVALGEELWATINRTAGANDPVQVEVTKIEGGNVTGPIKESWTIAQGSLKGAVFYNSYDSVLAGKEGAVMRIRPGSNAEVFLGGTGKCTVCHSVSANGNALVAVPHAATGATEAYLGQLWSVTNRSAPTKRRDQPNGLYNWGALSPDGGLLVTNAVMPANAPAIAGSEWAPNVPGVSGGARASKLVDPVTGAEITAAGWGSYQAQMPSFSPDGKKVVFNDYGATQGRTIAMMDFDPGTKTFSNYQVLYTDPGQRAGWPAFTPDGKYVVVNLSNRLDYGTWGDARGDLALVHVASKTVAKLDMANGTGYLPYGEAESRFNFEATVLPVPVGGYYWAVFTSRRKYGNTITHDQPYANNGAGQAAILPRKKLWVAAIDVDQSEITRGRAADLSHPAFYLPGQELEAGNMRGFWSLDACVKANDSCTPGGDECCEGSVCRQAKGGTDSAPKYTCVPKDGCAQENEACSSSSDCCGFFSGVECRAGKCTKSAPR